MDIFTNQAHQSIIRYLFMLIAFLFFTGLVSLMFALVLFLINGHFWTSFLTSSIATSLFIGMQALFLLPILAGRLNYELFFKCENCKKIDSYLHPPRQQIVCTACGHKK